MSRTEELHKLAELFHAQAEATLNPTAKQALHKMGDNCQREARQSEREVATDRGSARANDPDVHQH